MTDEPDVAGLLEERPGLEPAVEAVYEAEAAAGDEPWTFEDVAVDSGQFGELVSRGVVESVDDGYRLADEAATRAVLEADDTQSEPPDRSSISLPDFERPSIDRRLALAILGSLAVVVAFRLVSIGAVFRDGNVVLSGNDPYYYRYWVEQVVTTSGFDLGLLTDLPTGAATGEPLLIGLLSVFSTLLGGPTAIGGVMAWYPVVAAVLTAGLVYLLAVDVTNDRRVGLAAVLFLAIIPAHAMRTSLGFADHHALDYLWLVLSATALGRLAVAREARSRAELTIAAFGLGIGLAAQVLSWEAGPLLVLAVAPVVAIRTLADVRADGAPLRRNVPLLGGLALGAGLTWLGHGTLNWQTTTVASTPALLFAGALGVVLASEIAWRLDGKVRDLAIVEGGVGVVGILGLVFLTPALWSEILAGIGRITRSGSTIAEVAPLFSQTALGGIYLLGFLQVLAIPAMAWAAWRLWQAEPRWLVPVVYAWYFLGLSLYQVRFLGEFAPFGAFFVGLAFVWLAAKVNITELPATLTDRLEIWFPTIPSGRTLGALLALFVLVGGFAAVQVPVKTSQLAIEEETYETATWLTEYANDRGLAEDDRYVFSNWGRNRVYNYFLSGNSRSYSYAQSNYVDFIGATAAESWYERLQGRAQFVVTTDTIQNAGPSTLQHRLQEQLGSRGPESDGLGHYRALFVTEDRTTAAFRLVDGASVTGAAEPDSTVEVSTSVDVVGHTFTYVRQTTANATGRYNILVAHPGEYTVDIGEINRTVRVPESAVQNGSTVTVNSE